MAVEGAAWGVGAEEAKEAVAALAAPVAFALSEPWGKGGVAAWAAAAAAASAGQMEAIEAKRISEVHGIVAYVGIETYGCPRV